MYCKSRRISVMKVKLLSFIFITSLCLSKPQVAIASNFADAPPDTLVSTFSYLSIPDIVNASTVNRHWRECTRDPMLINELKARLENPAGGPRETLALLQAHRYGKIKEAYTARNPAATREEFIEFVALL